MYISLFFACWRSPLVFVFSLLFPPSGTFTVLNAFVTRLFNLAMTTLSDDILQYSCPWTINKYDMIKPHLKMYTHMYIHTCFSLYMVLLFFSAWVRHPLVLAAGPHIYFVWHWTDFRCKWWKPYANKSICCIHSFTTRIYIAPFQDTILRSVPDLTPAWEDSFKAAIKRVWVNPRHVSQTTGKHNTR